MGNEPATWYDLRVDAPEIARLGKARMQSPHVALLGTLCRDGSPRISPIEPHFVADELLVGAMTWSRKAHDLLRDPRYVLHSAVTDPDSGAGDFRLYGSAAVASADVRDAAADAWWSAWPADKSVVFCLHIARAAYIEWDLERGEMTVHRWSRASGHRRFSRGYP